MIVKFWINGRTTVAHDLVKPISFVDKVPYYSYSSVRAGELMAIPLKNLTHYYDVQSKEFKNQEFIKFEMKVTSLKSDEVAKNENVKSNFTFSRPRPSFSFGNH